MSVSDVWLSPDERLEFQSRHACELITYVVTGALTQDFDDHVNALVCVSEFRSVTVGAAQVLTHTNASVLPVHMLQLTFKDPEPRRATRQAQQHFPRAQRRGVLCVVAAADRRSRVLPLRSDAVLFSSVLDPGQHLVHAFALGHGGLLHVISGEVRLADYVLGAGDSARLFNERSVSFTAREPAEVLLCDVNLASAGRHRVPSL